MIGVAKQSRQQFARALSARDLAQLQRRRLVQETKRAATSPAAFIGAFGGGLVTGWVASRPKKIIVAADGSEVTSKRPGHMREVAVSVTKRLINLALFALVRDLFAS